MLKFIFTGYQEDGI